MTQLSIEDCETLLRELGGCPAPGADTLRATANLRRLLEQAIASQGDSDPALEPSRTSHASGGTLESCTVHVCTSCRLPGTPRDPRENRPGFKLCQELRAMLDENPLGQHVEVRPAQCLSLCPRPCGIALSSPGAWTYLFGDQQPGETAGDVLECISTYLSTGDGHMPRERRPKTLRTSVLGRVPPPLEV